MFYFEKKGIKFLSLTIALVAFSVLPVIGSSNFSKDLRFQNDNSSLKETEPRSELGLSIDLANNPTIDLTEIKDGSSIFNDDWLENQLSNLSEITVNSTESRRIYTSSFSEMSNSICQFFDFDSNLSLGIDIFNLATGNAFQIDSNTNASSYVMQSYNTFISKTELYTLSLPNYSSNKQQFIDNLNENYLERLDKLFLSSNPDYASFFKEYGTHFIAKGVYGGTALLTYYVLSNEYKYYENFNESIKSSYDTYLTDILQTQASIEFNGEEALNCSSGDIKEFYHTEFKGGRSVDSSSPSRFGANYQKWLNSVSSDPVLIRSTSDGLIPLWEILPEKYSSRSNEMKNAYINYAKSLTEDVSSKYDNDSFVFTYNYDKELDVYYDEYEKNDYIDIDMSTLFNIGFANMNNKYNYVSVLLYFDIKEIDDGYQHIALRSYGTQYNQHIIVDELEIEHGEGYKDTSYERMYKSFMNNSIGICAGPYNSIMLNLGLGARGNKPNAWSLKDLTAKVIFSAEMLA